MAGSVCLDSLRAGKISQFHYWPYLLPYITMVQSIESERKSETTTTLSRVGGKYLSANLRSAASLTSEALMGRAGVGCNPTRDCDAVIRDIKRMTMGERVRIMDLFQDFDHLQHGEGLTQKELLESCHKKCLPRRRTEIEHMNQ